MRAATRPRSVSGSSPSGAETVDQAARARARGRRAARPAPRGRTGCRRCGRAGPSRNSPGTVARATRASSSSPVAPRSSGSRLTSTVLWRPMGTDQPSVRIVWRAVATRVKGRRPRRSMSAVEQLEHEGVGPVQVGQDEHDRMGAGGRVDERQHGPGGLLAGALGIDLAQGHLVAHEVEQAVDHPLDLRRLGVGPERLGHGVGGRLLGLGQRVVGAERRRPGAGPRRWATRRWPRRRARSGPRTRGPRGRNGPLTAASSARRDLPTPASPMSSSRWARRRSTAADDRVGQHAQLGLAAHERRLHPPGPMPRGQQRLDGRPGLDRLVPALGVDRPRATGRR